MPQIPAKELRVGDLVYGNLKVYRIETAKNNPNHMIIFYEENVSLLVPSGLLVSVNEPRPEPQPDKEQELSPLEKAKNALPKLLAILKKAFEEDEGEPEAFECMFGSGIGQSNEEWEELKQTFKDLIGVEKKKETLHKCTMSEWFQSGPNIVKENPELSQVKIDDWIEVSDFGPYEGENWIIPNPADCYKGYVTEKGWQDWIKVYREGLLYEYFESEPEAEEDFSACLIRWAKMQNN